MYREQSGEYVYWCQGVKGYVALPILIVWVFLRGLYSTSADGTCEGRVCHPNADCFRKFPEARRQCKCRDGWQGDGFSCSGKVVFFFSLNFFPCHSSVTSFLAIFTKLKAYYWANSVSLSHQTSTNVSHPVTLTVTQRLSALIQKDLMNAIASRVTLVMVLTAHVS